MCSSDLDGRPGSGSKLYYINPWAMCLPSDHPMIQRGPGLAEPGIRQTSLFGSVFCRGEANIMQTKETPISSNANPCQKKIKGLDVRGYANLANFVQTKFKYTSVSAVVPIQGANQCIRDHSRNTGIHICRLNDRKDT